MTKEGFLNQLREALEDEEVKKSIIEETIQEYASMIDDALESGESIEVFIKKMGTPKKVAKALAKDRPGRRSNRLTALSPFIATILFFLAGSLFQAWHPGWLFFLLIPITGILTSKPIQWRGLLIFTILIVFILVGTSTNLWNPLWSLFLLVIPQSQNKKNPNLNRVAMVYTYIAVAVYHVAVIYFGFSFVGGSQELRNLYLTLSLLVFLPILLYGFWNGSIQNILDLDWKNPKTVKDFLLNLTLVGGVTIGYLVLGFGWGLWHPGWLVFLIIPMVYILIGNKRLSLTGLMPFIATILFVLVGEYLAIPGQASAYSLSWVFFLLIPIVGILEKGR
ncbi:MAG: hypothetical protein FJ352_00305 [Firmicutes bacterium]|nr:hypothetical protein [Bacillota bacterium]